LPTCMQVDEFMQRTGRIRAARCADGCDAAVSSRVPQNRALPMSSPPGLLKSQTAADRASDVSGPAHSERAPGGAAACAAIL
jgi:hypothetical protein